MKRHLKVSSFDLGSDLKTSFEMGRIIPLSVSDVLPGDTWRVRTRNHIRLAPQLAPFMHRLKVCHYSFSCPKRLLWEGFEEFITGGESGNVNTVVPYVTPYQVLFAVMDSRPTSEWTNADVVRTFGPGTLWDYMGLPPIYTVDAVLATHNNLASAVNWLPFRAYYKIWFEYFRDQNLIPSTVDNKPRVTTSVSALEIQFVFFGGQYYPDAPDTSRFVQPYKKAWEKDYFTAGLPWPQRGPEVRIPGTVEGGKVVANGQTTRFITTDGEVPTPGDVSMAVSSPPGQGGFGFLRDALGDDLLIGDQTGLEVDLSGSLGTINELRVANRLQMWMERAARAGGRFTEHLLGHWGEFNRDSRLQRPEWLGSHTSDFFGEAVLQTSFSNDESAQANPAGNSENKTAFFWKKHFTEDAFIIQMITVLPNTSYQDGIPRMYSRLERFDHAFPDFAHLGEQSVKNKEVYAPWLPNALEPNGDFSYVPRYSDYKYEPSRVTGDFRSSLAFWHMSRMFYDPQTGQGKAPAFNRSFIESDPSKRIFPSQVEGDDVVWAYISFERKVTRKLPKWPIPKL